MIICFRQIFVVKCRPVIHHCAVLFFWSSGVMDCMLFTFENRVPVMRWGRNWRDIFHLHWWTVKIKPTMLYSMQIVLPVGLPLFLGWICMDNMMLCITLLLSIYLKKSYTKDQCPRSDLTFVVRTSKMRPLYISLLSQTYILSCMLYKVT